MSLGLYRYAVYGSLILSYYLLLASSIIIKCFVCAVVGMCLHYNVLSAN